MRSRADTARAELALRVVALAALAAWGANALRPATVRVATADAASLASQLPGWTGTADPERVHVALDRVPDRPFVDWLAALDAAGVRVTWSGAIAGTAMEAWRAPDPSGDVVVMSSSSDSAIRVVADELGPLDTLPTARAIYATRVRDVAGALSMRSGRQAAAIRIAASAAARRVLVIGAAGWEAKFVIAALEERGWLVDSRLRLSPDHVVSQGSRADPDTARWSALVLLDSASAESARGVERFVREGGGLVLAGDASRAPRAAPLVAWSAARRAVAPLGTAASDTTWRGLSRVPLVASARGAIELEPDKVLARRHYAGRVVALGYDQTWRWRMAGGDESVASHRDWWSRLVAASVKRDSEAIGVAPLAALHAALGAPSPAARVVPGVPARGVVSQWLGAIMLAALLVEWVLRRRRGAR